MKEVNTITTKLIEKNMPVKAARTFFRLPEDGSGLELRQADEHPAQPPALVVRAQAVQEG